jgi:hypothetical protein
MMLSTGAFAATCGAATSPGTAPPAWQSYCWIDMTDYNNAAVMSAAGQAISITLSDGSVFSFTLKGVINSGTPDLTAIAPPSWTGSAVGNTAFLGIPNKPILYTNTSNSNITLTLSNIVVTPPVGSTGSGLFRVVIADAESTNGTESLTYITNGGAWAIVDQVDPISGTTYPPITGVGTNTFTETGAPGQVGAYIVATQSPTTVTVNMVSGGKQGIMFAVQYATISVNKAITGGRANLADQFTYGVKVQSSGTTIASATSAGTGNGPFTSAVATIATSVPMTIFEQMAPGSVSVMAQYNSILTCTNGLAGSPTVLPNGTVGQTGNINSLAYGDAIACTFSNTPKPAAIIVRKTTVGAPGGEFAFSQTNLASTPSNLSTTIAGGSASAAAINASAINTAVTITEATNPNFTLTAASCTDANATVTLNPATFGTLSGQTLTIPAANVKAAAQITCTFTNTANGPRVTLQKALAGTGRVAASDQFTLRATGPGVTATQTTTGSGLAVTSTALSANLTAGGSYTLDEIMAPGSASALSLYLKSASCTNSNPVGTNVSGITAYPITITPAAGDGISCTITNRPVIARLAITKSFTTASTPVVVGQIITYRYDITNTGNVAVNNVSVSDLHGTPGVLVPIGAGGIRGENITTVGSAASTDITANDGIWNNLAPGATVRFIYTHTVTQAEIDNG